MKRRKFLNDTVKATAGVAATSLTTARSQSRVFGANDRIRIGLIGCGGRGMKVAKSIAKAKNVECIAVADVYPKHLDRAKEWAGADLFRNFMRTEKISEKISANPTWEKSGHPRSSRDP